MTSAIRDNQRTTGQRRDLELLIDQGRRLHSEAIFALFANLIRRLKATPAAYFRQSKSKTPNLVNLR